MVRGKPVKKAYNPYAIRLATKKDQPGDPVRSQVIPKDGDPFKAKAEAKARALSSDALAEALAKGQRREAESGGAEGEGGGGRRGLAQLGSAPGFEPQITHN